jgi:hypothetical protein
MATIKDLKDITITSGDVESWSEYNVESSILNTIDWGNISINPVYHTGSDGYTYTTTSTGTGNPWITADTIDGYNTLSVRGNADFDSDITVKGRSLTEFMDSVEQRLNILRPNPELEQEWDQLRELGEQYRALEKQLAEKSQMWKTLKRQSPLDK